eukprot:scaffold72689_cov28-Tisochrysis_lutea.AAC.3
MPRHCAMAFFSSRTHSQLRRKPTAPSSTHDEVTRVIESCAATPLPPISSSHASATARASASSGLSHSRPTNSLSSEVAYEPRGKVKQNLSPAVSGSSRISRSAGNGSLAIRLPPHSTDVLIELSGIAGRNCFQTEASRSPGAPWALAILAPKRGPVKVISPAANAAASASEMRPLGAKAHSEEVPLPSPTSRADRVKLAPLYSASDDLVEEGRLEAVEEEGVEPLSNLARPRQSRSRPTLAEALRTEEVGPAGVPEGVGNPSSLRQGLGRRQVGLADDNLEAVAAQLPGSQLSAMPLRLPLEDVPCVDAPLSNGPQRVALAQLVRQLITREREGLCADGVLVLEPCEADALRRHREGSGELAHYLPCRLALARESDVGMLARLLERGSSGDGDAVGARFGELNDAEVGRQNLQRAAHPLEPAQQRQCREARRHRRDVGADHPATPSPLFGPGTKHQAAVFL